MIAPFHLSAPLARLGKLRDVDEPLTLTGFLNEFKTIPKAERKNMGTLTDALMQRGITSDLLGRQEDAFLIELKAVGNQLNALKRQGQVHASTQSVSLDTVAGASSSIAVEHPTVATPTHAPSPTGKHRLFVTA